MADVGRELNKLVALPMSTRMQGTRYLAWTSLVKTVDRRSFTRIQTTIFYLRKKLLNLEKAEKVPWEKPKNEGTSL